MQNREEYTIRTLLKICRRDKVKSTELIKPELEKPSRNTQYRILNNLQEACMIEVVGDKERPRTFKASKHIKQMLKHKAIT